LDRQVNLASRDYIALALALSLSLSLFDDWFENS